MQFHIGRAERMSRQDTIAEIRARSVQPGVRSALSYRRLIRSGRDNMPRRYAFRRVRASDQINSMAQQHIRTLRARRATRPPPRRSLRMSRPDELSRRAHIRRFPGDRAIKGKVHFERARAVSISLKPPAVMMGKAVAGDAKQLARRQVAQNHLRLRKLINIDDRIARLDHATQ